MMESQRQLITPQDFAFGGLRWTALTYEDIITSVEEQSSLSGISLGFHLRKELANERINSSLLIEHSKR